MSGNNISYILTGCSFIYLSLTATEAEKMVIYPRSEMMDTDTMIIMVCCQNRKVLIKTAMVRLIEHTHHYACGIKPFAVCR